MSSYQIGRLHGTKTPFKVPRKSFATHWHLIGHTGKGKTTAIHTLLHKVLLDPGDESCVILIDKMGNLSFELLLWMASDFCTQDVRDRLVYIEPARENIVMGFNPLIHQTPAHAYYRVCHASELILRGWANQNLAEMPRLARWMFNSFYACALLGLTISDSSHLLSPASAFHKPILRVLPTMLQHEWNEIMGSRSGSEASRLLESARNRLKPFHESPILRNMFGATTNRLDIERFMKERKIVVLNLNPQNRLPEQVVDAIGGLVINEVLTTARSLPFGIKYPTYLLLDEFQNFIGPDIEAALPEVRQLMIRLILSHQSFSQLKRGDVDLTSMIFQAQSRMIFGMQGEDADIIAHELASLRFDPMKVKNEIWSRKQRISGHRIEELQSWSDTEQLASNWSRQYGTNWSKNESVSSSTNPLAMFSQLGSGETHGGSDGNSDGGSSGRSRGTSRAEHLVPIYEEYLELSSRTFVGFEEEWRTFGRKVRDLPTGQAYVRTVDQTGFQHVDVQRSVPGHLALPPHVLAEELPEALEEVEAMIQKNFEADYFCSPAAIERETERRLAGVLQSTISVGTTKLPKTPKSDKSAETGVDHGFL